MSLFLTSLIIDLKILVDLYWILLSRATSLISIALIEQNKTKPKQLHAVAATRRSMDEITAALQHRPVLFFPTWPHSIPAPLYGAVPLTHILLHSLIVIVPPPVVVVAAVVAASIDTPDSFSQDACCFCIRATNVNSPYSEFFCALGCVSFISIIICLLLVRRGE